MEYEVGLFELGPEGVRLVGRTTAPDLVEVVRGQLVRDRAQEIERLTSPLRLVRDVEDHDG
jgi:hypothetical protein